MREVDLVRLSVQYSATETPSAGRVAEALGVSAPRWEQLENQILADLTTEHPYGISWWAPHPGTAKRILISDHLYSCSTTTTANLIEAAIHRLEFLDWREREDDFNADVVVVQNGKLQIVARPRQSALEELGPGLVSMHQLGVVRALSGALDCAAGAIIGVLALPEKILLANFVGIRKRLGQIAKPKTDGEQIQSGFAQRLEELIAEAGPTGWLNWAVALRNMLVHRGRRIEIGQFVPRSPALYGPDGQPAFRARGITHLPLDPSRSDIEVLFNTALSPVLTEDAQETLAGIIESTRRLLDGLGSELLAVWQWRRERRDKLPQPAEQWPGGRSTTLQEFAGYAPGSYKYQPSLFMSHPIILKRLRAASLDDRARHQWDTFD